MNTNKSRFFTRFVAAPVAAAGILGGVAMGMAAAANADPGPSAHSSDSHSVQYRSGDDSRDSHRDFRPDFWDFWTWHHHRDHSFRWHRDS